MPGTSTSFSISISIFLIPPQLPLPTLYHDLYPRQSIVFSLLFFSCWSDPSLSLPSSHSKDIIRPIFFFQGPPPIAQNSSPPPNPAPPPPSPTCSRLPGLHRAELIPLHAAEVQIWVSMSPLRSGVCPALCLFPSKAQVGEKLNPKGKKAKQTPMA